MQEGGAEPNLLYHKKREDRNHLSLFPVTSPFPIPSPETQDLTHTWGWKLRWSIRVKQRTLKEMTPDRFPLSPRTRYSRRAAWSGRSSSPGEPSERQFLGPDSDLLNDKHYQVIRMHVQV